jgi:hypothetical protein
MTHGENKHLLPPDAGRDIRHGVLRADAHADVLDWLRVHPGFIALSVERGVDTQPLGAPPTYVAARS